MSTKMKILDACCGERAFWRNKKHPDTTFIDIRKKVKPDMVMDCKNTSFPDKTFDLIVFDPPHLSYSKDNKGIFAAKWGMFRAHEIRALIKGAFIEFDRILKDDGFVIFKWGTHNQTLKVILPLITKFEILFGQLTAQKTTATSKTYWFTLRKKDLFSVA